MFREGDGRQVRAPTIIAGTVLLWLGAVGLLAAAPADVAGGRLVVQGAGVAPEHACERCHGLLGTGAPAGAIPELAMAVPRLAGQTSFYLRKQLEDFASGARPSEVMTPIARGLTPDQRQDVAAYYESLSEVPYPPQSEPEPALLQRGGVLSAVGDPERNVRACEICHADAGVGFPPSFPYLAGQYADYLERQMLLWKRGVRDNDPLDVMEEIAEALSDEEIRAVSVYFSRARPPLDWINRFIPVEPVPGFRPAPVPGS